MPAPCFRHSHLSCLALLFSLQARSHCQQEPLPAHASRQVLGLQTASHLSITTPCGLFTAGSPKRAGGQRGGHGPHDPWDLGWWGSEICLRCLLGEKSLF